MPTYVWPNIYRSTWTKRKSEIIKDVANELQISFLDLQYDFDIGIDWDKDSYDKGGHLNYRGAQKLTSFFSNYLKDLIQPRKNKKMETCLQKYNKETSVAELELEDDFCKYVQKLQHFQNPLCIFMTVIDCGLEDMTGEEKNALSSLGLQAHKDAVWPDAFLAIIDDGTIKLDVRSNNPLLFSYNIDNKSCNLMSKGFLFDTGNASIKIGGTEYSKRLRGLNIVAYDKSSKSVIDSVVFDFHDNKNRKVAHTGRQRSKTQFREFIKDYESYLFNSEENND